MKSTLVWCSHLATLSLLLLPACGDSSSDDGNDDSMATESSTGTATGTTGDSSPTTNDDTTSADTTNPTTVDTTDSDTGTDTGSGPVDTGTDAGSESGSETQSNTTGANCDGGDGPDFAVGNQGLSDYLIDGTADPDLTLVRGCTYTFDVDALGHPFLIKTEQSIGPLNTFDDGVTNNGTQDGVLTFEVPMDAPDTLFYICQFHAAMTGTLNIVDG